MRILPATVARPGRRGRTVGSVSLAAALSVGAACSVGYERSGLDRQEAPAASGAAARPNIVWIVADAVDARSAVDSFEGAPTTIAETAALSSDAASTRAALLTGMRPAVLGLDTETGRRAPPPAGVTVLPEQLRRAGYYTSRAGPPRHNLGSGLARPVDIVHVDGRVHEAARAPSVPVEDLAQPGLLGAWDAAGPDADWRGREKDWESPCTVAFGCGGARTPGARPFFALFNVEADTAGSQSVLDAQVDRIVKALEADDLLDETVVFLIGASGPTPAVAVRWPAHTSDAVAPDTSISLLDLAPTALALAGVAAPGYMEGTALVRRDAKAEVERPDPVAAGSRGMGSFADAATPAPVPEEAPVAATPGGYPTGGLFHVAPRIELWCDTAGSTIVYTTEHEAPFYWRLYTGPFRMRFWTLRFQCGRLGYRGSDIVTFDFDIE